MSNAVFPTFPGLSWGILKSPEWSTSVQQSVSGKEVRRANRSRAIWRFSLSYELLRGASAYKEFQTLVGFFNARQGSFDSFLLTDASDNAVTGQAIGTGDGVNKTFRLLHPIDTWLEPVGYAWAPTVYLNGVKNTQFTTDGENVTFTVAPAASVVVTWSGTFYYRVRFEKDTMEFEQFMQDFWTLKRCELIGVI